jgi:hypothetical protein
MEAQVGNAAMAGASLRLTRVSFTSVEFTLLDRQGQPLRSVVVRVGSGPSWRSAVRFPTIGTDATESTGDEQLDRAILDRTAEELVRLEATACRERSHG